MKTQEQKMEIFKLEIERITKSAKESIAKFKNEVAKSEAGVVGTAIFWYGNDAMIGEYILKELLPINIALGLLEDRNTTFDYFITQIEKEIERLRNDYYYPSSSGFAQEARNYAEYIAKFELAKKLREALSYIQKD